MKSVSVYIKLSATTLLVLLVWLSACKKPAEFTEDQFDERLSADAATVFDESSGAYGNVLPGLTEKELHFHDFGDKLFGQSFVTSPAPLYGGLGPVYNSLSCARCHVGEGRGFPINPGANFQTTFLKVSMPGADDHGGPLPVPGYGLQIQDQAIAGAVPEAKITVNWVYSTVTLGDGTTVELREPQYTITNAYLPLPPGYLTSPRMPRPNFGIGVIEAIEEASILKHADPADSDGDGISGRPNYVWDYVTRQTRLGRIGWKAAVPDIKNQVAKALNEDIGVTSSVFPLKNAHGQSQMTALKSPETIDVPDSVLNALTFYMRTLAVPARRNTTDPEVKTGQKLFKDIGCVKCHVDVHLTKVDVSFPALSNLIARPYSDFLLHNMGAGLADNRSEFDANGFEWRTPPLWGIGLNKRVNGNNFFLHDGRARSFTEAVLWHSGEAEPVKNRFKALSTTERENLLKFLESL